jgi:hypothetical protein
MMQGYVFRCVHAILIWDKDEIINLNNKMTVSIKNLLDLIRNEKHNTLTTR